MVNPVLVALDVPSSGDALRLAGAVEPYVGGFKVGLQLLMAEGPLVIDQVSELGLPVFVDAKLHDIPNTVAGAARAIGSRGARWVTVHASGGMDMLLAAAEALADVSGGHAGVLAVTVLTSLDEGSLARTGVDHQVGSQVETLARLALEGGAEGVICSPHESGLIKGVSDRLLAVTPGIRLPGAAGDDQARVSTPLAALDAGADYLVIGRAISASADPQQAAYEIAKSISVVR